MQKRAKMKIHTFYVHFCEYPFLTDSGIHGSVKLSIFGKI